MVANIEETHYACNREAGVLKGGREVGDGDYRGWSAASGSGNGCQNAVLQSEAKDGNARMRALSFPGVNILHTSPLSKKAIPLLLKEGWTRHPANVAKPPFKGADGVVASLSQRATTPSAPIRRLRIIFLDGAATPPSKGGELPLSTVRDA